jgi:hypothetical protein
MENKYSAWVGKTIQFTEKALDLECYPEAGMRAKVVSAILSEDSKDPYNRVFKVVINFEQFDEFNRQFESANYFDKSQRPTLTAREAGFYKQVDTLYLSDEVYGPWSDIFTVVGEKAKALFASYVASKVDMSYVEWLEEKAVL